jgi:hypothetical protein
MGMLQAPNQSREPWRSAARKSTVAVSEAFAILGFLSIDKRVEIRTIEPNRPANSN